MNIPLLILIAMSSVACVWMWREMYINLMARHRAIMIDMERRHTHEMMKLEEWRRYLQGRVMPDDNPSHYRHGL